MNWNRFLLLLVFLLALQSAGSFVSVHLKPLDGEQIQGLYKEEIGTFITRIENHEEETVEKVSIRWDVDPDLVIVDGLETSKSRSTTIKNLAPREERLIELKIKPVIARELVEKPERAVSVSYGIGSYDYYAGTYVRIIESPLRIEASLAEKVIKPGEAGEVRLRIKNVSKEEIKIASARLLLPSFFSPEQRSELGETILAPEQEVANKFLKFSSEPSFVGNTKLVLRVEFEDSIGKHVIEKDFSIESRGVDYGLLALIGFVVLLVIAVLYSKKKQEPKKPA